MTKMEIYQTILEIGLLPLFYHPDQTTAVKVASACLRGGARVIEFTDRGQGALAVFQALRHELPDAILGVGSIANAQTAALYTAHGAQFIVGPYFNREVADFCNQRQMGYIPGAATPGEIGMAQQQGAEIVKIFPAETLGAGFIKAILGPMPWSRLMPTGGVTLDRANIEGWLSAGAACLGMGSSLIRQEWLAGQMFEQIESATARVIGWVRAFRNARKSFDG